MRNPISSVEEVRYSNLRAIRPPRSPVVILLHSSGSSARQWDALSETLQTKFRVHAIEFRGHGAQAAWHGLSPLTLADEARLVEPLLAGSGGVHLVGHSYGAAVALKVASMYPGSVRSVVAYEPVLFHLLIDDAESAAQARDVFLVAESIRDRLAQDDEHAAAEGFVDFWSGAGAWKRLSDNRKSSIATRMKSVLRHFDALVREPLQSSRLARLTMPMMVLTGERTVAATRRLGELLRRALPFSQHELMPGLDHMGPITNARDVNRWITDFLHAQILREAMQEPVGDYA